MLFNITDYIHYCIQKNVCLSIENGLNWLNLTGLNLYRTESELTVKFHYKYVTYRDLLECELKLSVDIFFSKHEMTCHLPTVSVLNSPVMYFVPGFEITIDHPHTDVVKCSQLVRGRGFLLCSLCPLLLFVPPQIWVGRGVKTLLIVT